MEETLHLLSRPMALAFFWEAHPKDGSYNGSNDMVVGKDHLLGPGCQWYDWQLGWCGSMAFGSSSGREKVLI